MSAPILPAPPRPTAFVFRARSVQDQVLYELGTAILRGDYPEDSMLPSEAELAQRYAVSKTVLREVLKTLAAKGLLISRTKIGTRIRPQIDWNFFDADLLTWRLDLGLDRRFLESLYEIRLAVEPAAAALAAVKRSEDDLTELQRLVAEMHRPGHDRTSFATIDLALHLQIASASGNPFMRAIGNIIEAVLITTLTQTTPSENSARLKTTAGSHARIVEAITARDANGASAAMRQVIEEGRRSRLPDPADQNGRK
jgi:DNA-binding FadR family transcriptional regulator